MSTSRIRAVLWDMDGVIADTGPYHFAAWQHVFTRQNVQFTEQDFQRHFGQRNDTIIRSTLGEQAPDTVVLKIADEKEAKYRELVRSNVQALPGALKLIRMLSAWGFRSAITSSAPLENIQLILNEMGIADEFDTIVSGRDVTEGKPSPQIYLCAAEKLDAAPGCCIVIEDAVAGVRGARAAGMACIAVTTTHPAEHLQDANTVVTTLETVDSAMLDSLLDCK